MRYINKKHIESVNSEYKQNWCRIYLKMVSGDEIELETFHELPSYTDTFKKLEKREKEWAEFYGLEEISS